MGDSTKAVHEGFCRSGWLASKEVLVQLCSISSFQVPLLLVRKCADMWWVVDNV